MSPEVAAWAESIADLPVTPAEVAAGQRLAGLLGLGSAEAA